MSEPIPVLTLWQPWASLVALQVKTIETRSWSTKYRGPLAIHAATKRNVGTVVGPWKVFDAPYEAEHFGTEDRIPLPLGAIIATATLVDVVPIVGPDHGTGVILPDRALIDPGPAFGLRWTEPIASAAHGWKIHACEDQRPYGDFTPGRFAWLLTDVEALPEPVPFKGGQRLAKKGTPR